MAAALVLFCLTLNHANAQPQSTCDTLANNLRQDELIQQSDQRKFQNFQNIISDERFRNWVTASQSTLDGNITVPGYVDATLGTTSDSNNWEKNWSKFRSLQSGSALSREAAVLITRSASQGAYDAIVRCATELAHTRGMFAILDQVPSSRTSFVIRIHHRSGGTGAWRLNSFDVQPRDAVSDCTRGAQRASFEKPIEFREAEVAISCSKDPNAVAQVSLNTSEGSPQGFILASVRDEFQDMRDQLARMQAEIASQRSALTAAQSELGVVGRRPTFSVTREIILLEPNSGLCRMEGNDPRQRKCTLPPPQQAAPGVIVSAIIGQSLPDSAGHGNTVGRINQYGPGGGDMYVARPDPIDPGWKWRLELLVIRDTTAVRQ